ncbi:MAG: FkbM family methyltransferase [Pseudolabrys sp.]
MNLRQIITKVNSLGASLRQLHVYDRRAEHQLPEISILKKFVETYAVDCIFDIGANQGQYARLLRKNVGFQGTIISVEPNPETFSVLRSRSDTDPNWRAENIGLAAHDGEQSLSIMAGHQFTTLSEPITTEAAHASNVSSLNTVTKRIQVPVKTLKTFYLEAKNATPFEQPFLKMDTQGYDAVIADSADDILKKFIGIQTEVSFVRLYSDSIQFHESLDFYARRGFTLCGLVPNNAGHFPYLIEQDAVFINNDFLKNGFAVK